MLLDTILIYKSLYMIKQAYSNILDQKAKNIGIDKTEDQGKALKKFHIERQVFSYRN